MSVQPDLEKIIRQTKQYEFADGLREIQYGVILFFIGSLTWVGINPSWLTLIYQLTLEYGRWAILTATLLLWLIPISIAIGTLLLINWARRRWLWRESGMVKASRHVVSRRTTLIASATMVAGFLVDYLLIPQLEVDEWFAARVLYASMGWGCGAFFIAFSRDVEIRRYVWIGVIGGLTSTLLLFFPLQFGEAGLAFGLGWGVLLVSSGLWVLRGAWKNMRGENIDG